MQADAGYRQIADDVWQTWPAGGTARGCITSADPTPRTLTEIQAQFPAAQVFSVGLDQGCGNTGPKADADVERIATGGTAVVVRRRTA